MKMKPIKILVISDEDNWQNRDLVRAGRKMNIQIRIINLTNLTDLDSKEITECDVVFWRSSSLKTKSEKPFALLTLSKKIFINYGLVNKPYLPHKNFQQSYVRRHTNIPTIDTYVFNDIKNLQNGIDKGNIKFPFITKPDLGSRGEGVIMINNQEELSKALKSSTFSVGKNVFQNYIQNDGDYRVLVLGGKVLGVMKRIAQEGSYLNNISKGGKATREDDLEIVKLLSKYALKISSRLDLNFVGVDFIYDSSSDQYKFLELNTVPQWEGFQNALNIDVSKEVILYLIEINNGKVCSSGTALGECIYNYYFSRIDNLSFSKKFHFLSRIYAWTREEKYLSLLDKVKNIYVGNKKDEINEKINYCLEKSVDGYSKMIDRDLRLIVFNKYPKLFGYISVLFYWLWSKNIYNQNLKDIILEKINLEDLIKTRNELINDKESIKILSTHAVNYLYLSQLFINTVNDQEEKVSPKIFFDLVRNDNTYVSKHPRLAVYFLTHCIICESEFYKNIISTDVNTYREMLGVVEKVILDNYFELSLDIKFEYLVCAKLVSQKAKLENLILSEARMSLSPIGNYLVDKYNYFGKYDGKRDINISEHRNILFIMSQLKKEN